MKHLQFPAALPRVSASRPQPTLVVSAAKGSIEQPNHVWSYDFVQYRTHDGRAYRILDIIDEFTEEALMIRVDGKLNSTDVSMP